jgi:hypothetical protein
MTASGVKLAGSDADDVAEMARRAAGREPAARNG